MAGLFFMIVLFERLQTLSALSTLEGIIIIIIVYFTYYCCCSGKQQ
jgi:hypothetical protein